MDKEPLRDDLHELVARAKAGDASASERLFQGYLDPILARVRRRMPERLRHRMESMDLVQTGVREAIRDLEKFEWRGPHSFYFWLCRIVENKIRGSLRHWHAQRRRFAHEAMPGRARTGDAIAEQVPATSPGPPTRTFEDERLQRLRAEVDRLGGRPAEVIRLSLDGYSDGEIGWILGLSRASVQRTRVAGVRSLSFQLGDLLDDIERRR